jgi:MarR family transcriptional regulator for hemolysin
MNRPQVEPIGLQVTRTAKLLSRAFDEALAAAGGSPPTWLVLVSLKAQRHHTQRELAEGVGIEPATLTHHLTRMEAAGLVRRSRDAGNRRVQVVELTEEGDAAFHRLRSVVMAFDRRLRAGLTERQVAMLGDLLGRLRANAADPTTPEVLS